MAQRQVQIIIDRLQMPVDWRPRQQLREALAPPPGLSRPLNPLWDLRLRMMVYAVSLAALPTQRLPVFPPIPPPGPQW